MLHNTSFSLKQNPLDLFSSQHNTTPLILFFFAFFIKSRREPRKERDEHPRTITYIVVDVVSCEGEDIPGEKAQGLGVRREDEKFGGQG